MCQDCRKKDVVGKLVGVLRFPNEAHRGGMFWSQQPLPDQAAGRVKSSRRPAAIEHQKCVNLHILQAEQFPRIMQGWQMVKL